MCGGEEGGEGRVSGEWEDEWRGGGRWGEGRREVWGVGG